MKKIKDVISWMIFIIILCVTIIAFFSLRRDYDYICNIDFADSSDETIDVEDYYYNYRDGVFKFTNQDGSITYIALEDDAVTCDSYIDK